MFSDHIASIASYCEWRTGSPTDAQDAVAEVFLIAWRRLDEIPPGGEARPWLYATARRVTANQARGNARRTRLHEKLHAVASVTSHTDDGSLVSQVDDALSALGKRDREVLLLAEWEGLTPTEIGLIIGRPAVTVRGRLHRARRRFRAAFEASQAPRAKGDRSAPDSSQLDQSRERRDSGLAINTSSLRKELRHADRPQPASPARS